MLHDLLEILWRTGVGAAFLLALAFGIAWYCGEFRVQLLWVWRDLWVGVYVAKEGPVYICLLPTVVVKITPTWRLP